MWPWDHVAVGYVLYSLAVRLGGRRPSHEVFVLAGAALLPDLVDKPLSWGLGLFPAGYSVAHSVFVAIPSGALALALSVRRGRPEFGLAFVVGYWSHLLGDVAWALLLGERFAVGRVLWPLVELPGYATQRGLVGRTLYYLGRLPETLAAADTTLLAASLAPVSAATLLWLLDGAPGLPRPRRWSLDPE